MQSVETKIYAGMPRILNELVAHALWPIMEAWLAKQRNLI